MHLVGTTPKAVTQGAKRTAKKTENGEENLIDQCIADLDKSFAAGSGEGFARTEEEERKENEEGIQDFPFSRKSL